MKKLLLVFIIGVLLNGCLSSNLCEDYYDQASSSGFSLGFIPSEIMELYSDYTEWERYKSENFIHNVKSAGCYPEMEDKFWEGFKDGTNERLK